MKYYFTLLVSLFLLSPVIVRADADVEALKARINALENELKDVKAVLDQQAQKSASKEDVTNLKHEIAETRESQNEWKVYDSRVHLAGYAAANYDTEDDQFNRVQFSPIFHYQYKDLVLLESELEFNVGAEDAPDLELEYATIDLLLNDYVTLVVGKLTTPLGQFRPNLHPDWINKMPSAPVGFGHDGAAPVSDTGVEVRGGFPLSLGQGMYVNYAAYVGNGPKLELTESGDEIDAIAAEGFTSDEDGNKIFGGHIGLLPVPNVEIGLSAAGGDVALVLPNEPDRSYRIYGADFATHWHNFSFRAEWIRQSMGGEAASAVPDKFVLDAWYTQLAYRILSTDFEAILRYGEFDSPHPDQAQDQLALGLDYWFNSHTVAKLAYEFNDGATGEAVNDDRLILQLGYGF